MSEPRTARTRLRFVLGMPTRKTDFQIWELTMPSCSALRSAMSRARSQFNEPLRIDPLPPLLVKLLRFVDNDLSVGRVDEDLGPLQGTRCWSFEVDPRLVVPAPVARALELVLGRKPVWSAAQVRAHRDQRIHDLLGAHQPDPELVFPPLVHFTHGVVAHEAGLESLHRLEQDVGEHEAAQNAGQAAESSSQREPGGGQNEGEIAASDLALFADVPGSAPGEGSLRDHLIWRDFFRHQELVKDVTKSRLLSAICGKLSTESERRAASGERARLTTTGASPAPLLLTPARADSDRAPSVPDQGALHAPRAS